MKIVAGIVTYNPDLLRLDDNITSIYSQVDVIVIVDNHSNNLSDICVLLEKYNKINLIKLQSNFGIAYAQNQICNFAMDNNFDWVLVLDQDSLCPVNIISEYRKYSSIPNVGMLCPLVNDINSGIDSNSISTNEVDEVNLCIASASALKISAWKEVGGFYEPFFIDSVDFDMCMVLRKAGYKIIRINNVILLHEVGHSKKVRFLGKEHQILNHSALRYYYMYRNLFLLSKRHHSVGKFMRTNVLRFLMINIYEDHRLIKDLMIIKGLYHGLIGKFGKYGS